ncbi:MAG TPA: hypothetical protein VKP12_13535, partial [Kiloniellaceae bacterium]|nr:hypothetical protein [Kiloniellaceae bacterium]
MFSKNFRQGMLVSALALTLGGGVAAAQPGSGAIEAAADQLASRTDAIVSSANLEVLPLKMAGSCPRTLMLQVDVGAEAPGTLAYRIETLDGRTSQVLEAPVRAHREGGYAARIEHEIKLDGRGSEDAEGRLAFSAPPQPEGEAAEQRDFFERLFGTAADRDPAKGLGQQSFRVRVMAPNEVVSAFDSPSVSCEYTEMVRVFEEQRDGGDRPGRDRPGRDPGGR